MKEDGTLIMMVLFCKIQCPFICLCKPSGAHVHSSSAPLKSERSPRSAFAVDKASSEEVVNGKEKAETDNVVKSCIRKPHQGEEEEAAGKKKTKKVEWMDMVMVGKQVAEMKEFECSRRS